MTSHSLSLRLLEYDIFILILAHLKKIPNGFYSCFREVKPSERYC
jgi:hypothetical protein